MHSVSEPPPAARQAQWTLVRNARQLLTLRGPAGPRCGQAMAELGIIPQGALLIHDGVIREVGPTRRVEHLAEARNAREIDASGRVVMPAFVDADFALVDSDAIRLMSRRRLLARAAARSDAHARYGCLTAGAHTRCADDLKSAARLLRLHRTLHCRPLRLCPIFSPAAGPDGVAQLISKWLPAVMTRKLASIVELTVGGPGSTPDAATLRRVVAAAAGFGYAIRLRSPWRLEPAHLELALEAGAIALMAPMDSLACYIPRLTAAGVIRVVPPPYDNAPAARRRLRKAIEQGAAVAFPWRDRGRGGADQPGLTAEETIIATTWNAAHSLRMAHLTGSLEPGKSADVIVLDAEDYRDPAADAAVVIREGQIVHRRSTYRKDVPARH